MRLFLALDLPREDKRHFAGAAQRLRAGAANGSFTREDNLHLTLHFLGEFSRARELRAMLESFAFEPLRLRFERSGCFRRTDGNIVWLGPAANAALEALHARLGAQLQALGLPVESRRFLPHLTLARRVRWQGGFDWAATLEALPPREVCVDHLSLMRSDFTAGGARYTEVERTR